MMSGYLSLDCLLSAAIVVKHSMYGWGPISFQEQEESQRSSTLHVACIVISVCLNNSFDRTHTISLFGHRCRKKASEILVENV